MKKNLTFFSLGILLSAFVGFLFRTINTPLFQKAGLWLVVFGLLGIVCIILSFIFKSAKKFLLWFGLGALLYAVLIYGLRMLAFNNNTTLLVISLILGFVLLIIGLIKGK